MFRWASRSSTTSTRIRALPFAATRSPCSSGGRRSARCGEFETDDGPGGARADLEAPSVMLDDGAGQKQSQSAAAFLGRESGNKEALSNRLGNARPGIAHLDPHLSRASHRAHADRALAALRLDGVLHQVREGAA